MFQLQLFLLFHCDEWDRVVALPRHKFFTGATLLQLDVSLTIDLYSQLHYDLKNLHVCLTN
jgi:hypothetical protein